jgi:hypothetical protein
VIDLLLQLLTLLFANISSRASWLSILLFIYFSYISNCIWNTEKVDRGFYSRVHFLGVGSALAWGFINFRAKLCSTI